MKPLYGIDKEALEDEIAFLENVLIKSPQTILALKLIWTMLYPIDEECDCKCHRERGTVPVDCYCCAPNNEQSPLAGMDALYHKGEPVVADHSADASNMVGRVGRYRSALKKIAAMGVEDISPKVEWIARGALSEPIDPKEPQEDMCPWHVNQTVTCDYCAKRKEDEEERLIIVGPHSRWDFVNDSEDSVYVKVKKVKIKPV